MAERKETNPFTSEEPNPHLPPSIYQPNPFPINPAEGNPWAAQNNQPLRPPYHGHNNSTSTNGHSYNTSSDGGSQSNYPTYTMDMPNPSAYINSSYNYSNDSSAYNSNRYNVPAYSSSYNAYEHSGTTPQVENNNVKEEHESAYDPNTTELDESASTANPGIETHDPDKLKISSQMVKTSLNGAPNKWRLLSRFIQFIASIGAFAFIVGANPVSKEQIPDDANKTAIIFLHIVSIVSIIYSFGHLIFYCLRRWKSKTKAPRWALMLVDAIIGASFGTLMVFLIKDFTCKPGSLNRWCDFYNTAIFFTVLAFVTYAISFIWDIVGGFKRS